MTNNKSSNSSSRTWFTGLRRLHLTMGSLAVVMLLFTATTGAILAFEFEIEALVNPGLWEVTPQQKTEPIQPILNRVDQKFPDETPVSVTRYRDPTKPLLIFTKDEVERSSEVFVNPYTGEIIDRRGYYTNFFGWVERLHREMWVGETGRWFPAISAMLILILIPTGIYLWWPRSSRTSIIDHLIPRWTGNWKRFLYDCHRIGGLYLSIFLVLIATTGLMMSAAVNWPRQVVYFALDGGPPETPSYVNYQADPSETNGETVAIDQILKTVDQKAKQPIVQHVLLDSRGQGIRWILNHRTTFQRDNFFFDKYTGELIEAIYQEDRTQAQKVLQVTREIHTGTGMGLPGQAIAFVAALALPFMGVSGLFIWFNRNQIVKNIFKG